MNKASIPLFFILIFTFLLRIFRLEELFYFNMDEALLAFRGWGFFALERVFIIGGISPLGFHMPPYFYWLSAAVLKIANFNPIGWGLFAAVASCFTIYFLFLLIRKISSTRIALISCFLYATSFTAIFFDRHYWPLVFNPLLTTLLLWLLLVSEKKYKWIFISLILVFALSADPSNIPLFLIVIFYILRQKIKLATLIPSISIFLLLFLTPLVVFDLRHNGSNIVGVEKFFQESKNYSFQVNKLKESLLLTPRFFSQFWYNPWTNISYLHTYCQKIAPLRLVNQPLFLQLLAVILLVIYIISKRKSFKNGEVYLACLLLVYILSVTIYGGILGRLVFEHYLAGLLPTFAFLTAKVIIRFWVFGFFILVTLLAINLSLFLNANNPYGLDLSEQAVSWVGQEVGGQDFAFDTKSSCFRYNGIRYLFEINKLIPTLSFIDPNFFWLYAQKPKDFFPNKLVLFTDKSQQIDQPIIAHKQFGAWQVLILDNTQKTYKIEEL